MEQVDIELNVIDLYNGKVLSAKETPVVKGNLAEVISQFSGRTYMISRFTDCIDIEGNKLYEYDFVEVYKFEAVPNTSKRSIDSKIGEGQITFVNGSFRVEFINIKNGELDYRCLNDKEIDLKKIGNYFYKK
ncbi:hypothetical protein GIX45_06770 [Erwinia sp. CPCC 100877]|nr:hypothetical protein [Erwinia sp. CPCC 100877]